MRLTYLAIPFVAVLLTACGNDEPEVDTYTAPVPATENEYDLPEESRTMPSNPATTPATTGEGAGPGADSGADSGALSEPDTVQGTGAIH